MEPKPIAARLVATDHPSVVGQAKALLGPANLLQHRRELTDRHLPFVRPPRGAGGETELPFVLPQLEREKQCGGTGGLLINAGRCGCHRLAPSSLVSKVAKRLNSHGLVAPKHPT